MTGFFRKPSFLMINKAASCKVSKKIKVAAVIFALDILILLIPISNSSLQLSGTDTDKKLLIKFNILENIFPTPNFQSQILMLPLINIPQYFSQKYPNI